MKEDGARVVDSFPSSFSARRTSLDWTYSRPRVLWKGDQARQRERVQVRYRAEDQGNGNDGEGGELIVAFPSDDSILELTRLRGLLLLRRNLKHPSTSIPVKSRVSSDVLAPL